MAVLCVPLRQESSLSPALRVACPAPPGLMPDLASRLVQPESDR